MEYQPEITTELSILKFKHVNRSQEKFKIYTNILKNYHLTNKI